MSETRFANNNVKQEEMPLLSIFHYFLSHAMCFYITGAI